ncbi:MAG: diguanylate cyclase [Herminiimonas sp.]|nr:diguanylate cyclase [Herminiimonas sp.]
MKASHFPVDAYIVTLILGAVMAVAVALTALHRRRSPGAMPLVMLSFASAWWISCELLSRLFDAGIDRLIWHKLLFAGVVVTVPAFLAFALQYTNRGHWLSRRVLMLLAIEPILFNIAVWTDSHHGLVFGGWQGRGTGTFNGGSLFWVHSVYCYALSALTQILLIQGLFRAPLLHRAQAGMIIAAAVAPFLGNALTIFHLSPFPGRDLTPLGLVISSAMIATALFRRGLLDLVPIARDAVVELMNDAVLVVDRKNRVVDLNPAAISLLRLEKTQALGKPIAVAMAVWSGFSAKYLEEDGFHDEVPISEGRYVDLRITALRDKRGLLRGRLIVLRDITPLKRTSAALQDANTRLRQQLSEIEVMQVLLKEQAIRDALTGLYNRRFLEETLLRELSHAARVQGTLSLVIIDIDYFKHINDRHGHLAGDQVLHAMGNLLQLRSRGGDAACRFGGEEFVVVLPGASLETAWQRAEEWRQEFMALRVAFGDIHISATFSAGVATYPTHGHNLSLLMNAADVALYAAKSAGRNQVIVAQDAGAVQVIY